jgi:hypothetical protein
MEVTDKQQPGNKKGERGGKRRLVAFNLEERRAWNEGNSK